MVFQNPIKEALGSYEPDNTAGWRYYQVSVHIHGAIRDSYSSQMVPKCELDGPTLFNSEPIDRSLSQSLPIFHPAFRRN